MELTPTRMNYVAPADVPVAQTREIQQERKQLIQAVKRLNEAELWGSKHELRIFVDERTRRPAVRIVNRETQEVIEQYPPERVLSLAKDRGLIG
jgi:uncharacterized FlaG/YvyC family protein